MVPRKSLAASCQGSLLAVFICAICAMILNRLKTYINQKVGRPAMGSHIPEDAYQEAKRVPGACTLDNLRAFADWQDTAC